MRLNRTPRPAALAFILALAVGSGGAVAQAGVAEADRPAPQSSMRSAIPADQLGETAHDHVVYSGPRAPATQPLGEDPRSRMNGATAAGDLGETTAAHVIDSTPVAQHYRPGDGHASMGKIDPVARLGNR
ncbi:hypothetical protein [Salinisphaera orenii]|uniref:Uncharacterized protein n=1 Tax=Salinisphaera orenii YIM 95161 TaxID=1051139 RepID=A0A423PFI0_9GAMM|nr:hypothetical protein [Salinisphaera halophila]ROO24325.1 hypothetical protein SAHL_15850 [Salinisphaera halophila YIM 95161]